MRTPYCTLGRRRFGMKMIGMLLALSVSCVFPLLLNASLLQTHDWLFSLMSAIFFFFRSLVKILRQFVQYNHIEAAFECLHLIAVLTDTLKVHTMHAGC